jgi:hypothetical protein
MVAIAHFSQKEAFVDLPVVSHSKAFVSGFGDLYLFFKQMQAYEALVRITYGATEIGNSLKSKLVDATGLAQVQSLINKSYASYEALSAYFYAEAPNSELQMKALNATISETVVAIKVALYAQKAFAFIIEKQVAKAMSIFRDSSEIYLNVWAISESLVKIAKINSQIADLQEKKEKIVKPDSSKEVSIVDLQIESLRHALNKEYANCSLCAHIAVISALSLIGNLYVPVAGEYVMTGLSLGITLSGYAISYNKSMSEQIAEPISAIDKGNKIDFKKTPAFAE